MRFFILLLSIILTFGTGCFEKKGSSSKLASLLSLLNIIAANGTINISVNISRVSGIAPLSVFFDATGTTGLTNKGFFSNNAAYMDATFSWDFDADNNDPDGKYEKPSGFVAAHVFEHPGRYRVHLNVYDAAGKTASKDITITVSAFTGTTYYVATNGSDSNTGLSMNDPFLTVSHALTGSHVQPNTRILFRQGDIFSTPRVYVVGDGPVIVDSYQDPANPSSAKPIIYSTEADAGWSAVDIDTKDWRFLNLAVQSGGTTIHSSPRYPSGINFLSTSSNNLKYKTEEYQLGILPMSPNGEYNTIAACEFHNVNQTGYTSTDSGWTNDGGALIGNFVYDKTGDAPEHVFRLQGGSRYFIAYNTFGPNILVNYTSLTIRGNAEKVVIYKNKIMGWVQAITPQNNIKEEYQHHCIMDSNLIIGQRMYSGDRQTAIVLRSKDIVIRNNIIYDYQYGVSIDKHPLVGPSQRIKVYNNTFINPTSNDTFIFATVDQACQNIDIKNNLMLDLAGTGSLCAFISILSGANYYGESNNNLFYGSSWGASPNLFSGKNLAQWQSSTGNDLNSSFVDPLLASTDYNNTNFCKPQTGSPAINAGEFTPNATDYYGNVRDSSRDIGACEYH